MPSLRMARLLTVRLCCGWLFRGAWYRLVFDFDNKRFTEGKVTLPLIKVQDGQPVFIFTVVTDNPVA